MTPEIVLRYRAPSNASDGAVRFATTQGRQRSGVFFDGYADYGAASARALLAVADVAATRFYEPAAMVQARIRRADPVVTAEPDRLRFESFSACAGAHARFDLLEDGLDVRSCEPGTTNV